MKKINKFLALLLIAVLAFSLVSCGGKKEEESGGEKEPEEKKFKLALVIGVGGLGDGSFNDTLKKGCDDACAKYGIDGYQLIEPKEVAEFEGHFTDLSASGEYDLIVAGGFDAIDAMGKVAAEFPDQKYLFVDGEVPDRDNVTSVTYWDNEKTYLLGIIAAMTTETNKLGIVLALDIPSLRYFSSGFMAGAWSVNPDIDISVKVVGGFADTTTGKELALALRDEGCDIVFPAAGGSGLGCIAAAEESGDFKIVGIDTNQCLLSPDTVFVSGMRLMDVTVCNGIGEAINGTLKGGHQAQGLKEGAVTFTTEGTHIAPSAEAIAAANKAKEDIIAGKITVPYTYEEVGFEA
ncbi:MAG: BMP family ABC transporter substrate-binding protein [Oscillospiraceae bacterium]|jgi:basic membrane protein A|nr:BMP family ABC transporter substrate-binding protein [Oscillospiraceae bacterium]MBR4827276.1 BMP family ABC transporter substrate-binding protein [Oscillospiraceae bacterium]MBR5065535.1 BMP family ABC transporter substrate-binding protein [Oscillospiraceae bacterium]